MELTPSKKKDWILGIAGLTIGGIGSFTESWLLSGDLDHRYPFKIMSVPPPDYYVDLANTIASFAPFVAIGAGFATLLLVPRRKIIGGLVSVVLCPLIYIIALWYLVSNGPYKEQLSDLVNFDGTSASMRHQEFYFGAINRMLFSLVVYLIFVLLSFAIVRFLSPRRLS